VCLALTFFLGVLKFELRASYMLVRHPATWVTPLVPGIDIFKGISLVILWNVLWPEFVCLLPYRMSHLWIYLIISL
jgi:hypothetical protein